MGSFSYTCCISGLPIDAGDDVRYLLLVENPYARPYENNCSIDDLWVPRTFPLKARYDDYGSIEDVQGGLAQEVWLDSLKLGLVERGPGDNTAHDLPVRKDMNLKQILEAVWEGRVLVRQRERLTMKAMRSQLNIKPTLHKGIPTMKRVRKIIERAGFKLSDGGSKGGYLVCAQTKGFVRIRWDAYEGTEKNLLELQPILSDRFATMVTTGTRSYTTGAEMIVAPKPLKDGERYDTAFKYNVYSNKDLHIAQAMIREDVWRALCSMRHKSWSKYTPQDCQSWRDLAKDFWAACKKEKDDPSMGVVGKLERRLMNDDNPVSGIVRDMFVNGLGAHFDLMLEKNPEGADLEEFLATLGEMAFIRYILSNLRYQWHPSNSSGPQMGEWKLHKEFCRKTGNIISAVISQLKANGYY